MGEQEGSRSSDKTASLVLSIFKGENFVVKGLQTPCRVFLKAKCADLQPELALESGAVEITSTITEPEFNSQLAWSVSRKQLKELRSNRSIIKVTCFVVDRIGKEIEVGYVVLHVKDATAFATGVDVDPTKALTFPLLGTKDQWRVLQPKLQMILHLEDITPDKRAVNRNQVASTNQKTIKLSLPVPTEPNKPDQNQKESGPVIKNAAKLSETKFVPLSDTTFVWTVKEKEGYFQLGDPEEDDDLYILNTTIVSASYLHALWDGKSPRKHASDNYFWQIKYEAYGCEIASEPCVLGSDGDSRRTFIGDKAMARIRTNGGMFYAYLQETQMRFQIIRYEVSPEEELINPQVMGICLASLSELTKPDKREHKVCMEIMSEWGTPRVISVDEKPEVRVLFILEVLPNYFKLNSAIETNNNVVDPPDGHILNNSTGNGTPNFEGQNPATLDNVGETDDINGVDAGRTEDVPDAVSSAADFETVSNTSNARRLLQFEDQTRQNGSPPPSSSSMLTSPEKGVLENFTAQQRNKPFQPSSNFSESEDSDNTSNKENLARIMPPPGDYAVTIELKRFWFKCKKVITDSFLLSYTHPPLGILDKPIECMADPLESDLGETRHCFVVSDGQFTKTVRLNKLSESLLNEPLTVEFFKTTAGAKSKCFASCMIPFGRIFSEKRLNGVWTMENTSDVLKIDQNVKIGELFFKIKLAHQSSTAVQPTVQPTVQRTATNTYQKHRHSSFFPPAVKPKKQTRASEKYTRDPERTEKVTEDLREWRRTQEEIYKRQKEETEAAFLKILSEEAAERDAEREEVLSKKLADFEKKEKELTRQRKLMEEREEKLRQLDSDLKEKARKLALEQERLQQQSTLAVRRLEEDSKIEVEGLKRRIRGYQDDAEKFKTKVLLLEKKLETKEAEIDNLMALKRAVPDVRLEQRVSLLEQENKSLKNHLREANGRKEQYKKQSMALYQKLNRIQEERDQELKDQNENLRLQITASKEYKELKKERKAVQDLSQTLKALQKETVDPPHNDGKGDRVNVPGAAGRKSCIKKSDNDATKAKEDEMKRLLAERNRLLQSGAYTTYDSVIKQLQEKMTLLAQE